MTHWRRFAAPMSIFVSALLSVTAASATPTGTSRTPATATPAPGPSYTTTVVGPFGRRYRSGLALNNEGHVTGQTSGAQAFFYDGTLHPLGKPSGAKFSTGEGISDNDVIAATAQIGSVRGAYAVTYAGGHPVWTRLAGLPGYQESQAEAILPDGSVIAGELCATGDPACSHLNQHSLAVVWKRSARGWSAPMVLSTGKKPLVSGVTGIARNGGVTVVIGSIAPAGKTGRSVLWLLPGNRTFQLTGTGNYSRVALRTIAHGSGSTFYVAGILQTQYEGTYGEPSMWTVTCTITGCRQTSLQVIAGLGDVSAVNGRGAVIGYDRSGGDAGSSFIWQDGKETLGGPFAFGINNAGQLVAWRAYPAGTHNAQVVLLTPKG